MIKQFHALVLAAGKGTRFKSEKIKVLHALMGRSMVKIVMDTISQLKPRMTHLIIGYQKEMLMEEFSGEGISFITQRCQLGTAHAVMAASKNLSKYKEDDVLIMNGDLPLIRPNTLRPLLKQHQRQGNALTFMSAEMADPTGFGRVIYLDKNRIRIIEERDATPEQRKLKEGNVGIYVFKIKDMISALPKISNKNKKGEYYLTDIIEILSSSGKKVGVHKTTHVREIVGVNDRFELAKAVKILRMRKIESMALKGVTFYDPASTWIDFDVKIGMDTVIYPFVVLEGNCVIGKECTLYPGAHIINSMLGRGVKILPSTMIEECRIADKAQIGPFTHLRPNSIIKSGAKVGNFVEMKNTVFGNRSKAGHLSYVGDSLVGKDVNIGAGTITCNYDGIKKNKTIIDDRVFVGSGTQLVAPVKVRKGAYIAAGSTITKDVSSEALAVARAKQMEIKGWVRKKKKK